MQALEKSSFDNPNVLATVILPYIERSRCDQISLQKVFLNPAFSYIGKQCPFFSTHFQMEWNL